MQRLLPIVLAGALVGAVVVSLTASTAQADKAFRDEFIAKYVKADSKDAKDKAFADVTEKAKCTICHEGVSKKDRNVYGQALDKLLDRKADKDDKAKIQKALDTVAAMKANPKDPNSPTFGDLIKAGKLPGGAAKQKSDQVSQSN